MKIKTRKSNSMIENTTDSSLVPVDVMPTIVLDLNHTVLRITNEPIPDYDFNLWFEMTHKKQVKAYFIYFRMCFIQFLRFLNENFEVIIYSDLPKSILRKVIETINLLDGSIKFAKKFAANYTSKT